MCHYSICHLISQPDFNPGWDHETWRCPLELVDFVEWSPPTAWFFPKRWGHKRIREKIKWASNKVSLKLLLSPLHVLGVNHVSLNVQTPGKFVLQYSYFFQTVEGAKRPPCDPGQRMVGNNSCRPCPKNQYQVFTLQLRTTNTTCFQWKCSFKFCLLKIELNVLLGPNVRENDNQFQINVFLWSPN